MSRVWILFTWYVAEIISSLRSPGFPMTAEVPPCATSCVCSKDGLKLDHLGNCDYSRNICNPVPLCLRFFLLSKPRKEHQYCSESDRQGFLHAVSSSSGPFGTLPFAYPSSLLVSQSANWMALPAMSYA